RVVRRLTCVLLCLPLLRPTTSTPSPYTTLFRSAGRTRAAAVPDVPAPPDCGYHAGSAADRDDWSPDTACCPPARCRRCAPGNPGTGRSPDHLPTRINSRPVKSYSRMFNSGSTHPREHPVGQFVGAELGQEIVRPHLAHHGLIEHTGQGGVQHHVQILQP